jgi:nitroimidazol reductase NimA-like FMN-containing flavoprotein (pyridoxamine 5'-phosphate oxidase superfamily)
MSDLRQLTPDECESLLRHSRLARIAVRDAEGTYVVPISFAYADGEIYGHSPPGRKVTLMRRWPHISLLVDDITNFATWRSVLCRGKWHELETEDDRTRARLVLLRAFEGDLWWVTAGHGHRTALADAILYRIEIEEMTGMAQSR